MEEYEEDVPEDPQADFAQQNLDNSFDMYPRETSAVALGGGLAATPSVPFVDGQHKYGLDNSSHSHKCYSYETVSQIKNFYLIAILAWIFLVWFLDLFCMNFFVIILLSIPIVIFIINYFNVSSCHEGTESEMFKGNFVPFASLVVILIINWNSPAISDKTRFFKIIVTAFILLIISLFDLWVKKDRMTLVKNIKTALQTASLTLLAVALYIYYRDQSSYSGAW